MQDVIMIGSFLKGTECIGHLDGEIVVAFSNLPNSELCACLSTSCRSVPTVADDAVLVLL